MKTHKKIMIFLRAVGFILVTLAMLYCLTRVLKVHGALSNSDSLFAQEKESVEILYMGNCHAYSTFMPSVVEEITGLNGHVLAGSNQMAELTYYYMQSALKRQSPEYVVMEVFPFILYDSYAAQEEALDVYYVAGFSNLPLLDRVSYLREIQNDHVSWPYLLFELGYFHGRWTDIHSLGSAAYISDRYGWGEWKSDPNKLVQEAPEDFVQLPQTEDRLEISPDYLEYFYKVIELAEAEDVQLIFVTVPYLEMTDREAARYNTIQDVAESHGIPYLNLSEDTLVQELNFQNRYMADRNHVNAEGAWLISEYLAHYINNLENAES